MSVPQVVPVGGFALSGMVQAIKALYHIAGEINEFIDDHIEKLKVSDSPLIASTGRVLEAAKYGFGVGYMSSVAIIAVGQYLLGNTLAAVGAVLTAATLTNPIAMTCAAIGAIIYGWRALTDKERRQILESISRGLAMGIELIRSLMEFVIRKSQDLMTSSQLEDVKKCVRAQAGLFGKSLYDVTRKFGDLVKGGVDKTAEVLNEVAEKTVVILKEGKGKAAKLLRKGVDATKRIGRSKSAAARNKSAALPRQPPKGATGNAAASKTVRVKRRT